MAKRKMMRLPNGFGSVVYLGAGRRNPYAAKTATAGYDNNGNAIRKCLGYFETWQEAYECLADYNRTPYDVDLHSITFGALFEMLEKRKIEQGAKHSIMHQVKMAYDISVPLHNKKIIELKSYHLQAFFDGLTDHYSLGTLKIIRSVYNQLFDMAVEYDIVTKNYLKFVTINKEDDAEHCQAFTIAEIQKLWSCVDTVKDADAILVMCYSGFRASAYTDLKIDLDKMYFQGGVKTKAGKNRIVPIHSKIQALVINLMERGALFGQSAYVIRRRLKDVLKECGIDNAAAHHPHDCRATFTSLLDRAGVKDLYIDRLIGHASNNLTKDVYTDVEIDLLRQAVESIKV